jgi:hypothetical protein
MLEKYIWVGKKAGVDPDDVMDIILGTITKPEGVVADVLGWALDYDVRMEEGMRKTRLDS